MTTTNAARCLAAMSSIAALCLASLADAGSIRFFGNGTNDIDRVKIRIDDPATSTPGPPADIGAGDFTIEFWIKGSAADNNNTVSRCGPGQYGWIDGDIVFDRDRFNLPRSWGLALGSGRVAFGANVDNVSIATHCGNRNVLDGQWHHVAVTRSTAGEIRLFVDGLADGSIGGVAGDLSYPDNGQPQGNNCGGQPCFNSDPFIVLGAEKHDALPGRLAFNGFLDELRLSTTLRYAANFTVPTTPFSPDAATAGLYHFDEATTGNCAEGTVINDSAAGNASPGVCRFGGSPGGPVWSTDTPFATTGPGTLQLSAATYAAAEGTAARVITVTRSNGSAGAVSVSYATTDGTAVAPDDYTAVSNTLMWTSGDAAAKTFNIPIVDDPVMDPAESFTVAISAPSGGATLGTPASAPVTIADNDSPGLLQFAASGFTVAEGAGSATITVNRTNGTIGAVAVNYQSNNGTAFSPNDYTAVSGTLNWNNGEGGPKIFTVAIVDDAAVEGNETLNLALANASNGATISPPGAASLTITDNDVGQPGTLQLTQSSFTVNESAGALTITVSRANGSDGPAQVRVASTDGTALAGSDFQLLNQTLMWAAGENVSKTATLTITNDVAGENAETLTIDLVGVTGATLGTPASATVTINDDDPAGGGGTGGGGGGGAADLYFVLLGLMAAVQRWAQLRRQGILHGRL